MSESLAAANITVLREFLNVSFEKEGNSALMPEWQKWWNLHIFFNYVPFLLHSATISSKYNVS